MLLGEINMKYPKITQFVLYMQTILNTDASVATVTCLEQLRQSEEGISSIFSDGEALRLLGLQIIAEDLSDGELEVALSVPIQGTSDFFVCRLSEFTAFADKTQSTVSVESLCVRDSAFTNSSDRYSFDIELSADDGGFSLETGSDYALSVQSEGAKRLSKALSQFLASPTLVSGEKGPFRLFLAAVDINGD